MNKPKVTVIGSANIDLVTQTNSFPKLGETLLGKDFQHFPGGKGANQAVAAARLGGDVTFIGCVGDDDYGKQIKENLQIENVNVEHIFTSEIVESGIANIVVAEKDNAIIVIPGANHELNPEYVHSLADVILASDVIVLQLEIPIETVKAAVSVAHKGNIPIVLNPAPALPLPEELLQQITYITPNETEIKVLTDEEDIDRSIEQLFAIGSKNVILTRGHKGVAYGSSENQSVRHYEACRVEVTDTTGAGDTFNAAFAVSIAEGKNISEAINYANAAAGLSITKLGAQTGMPTFKEVKEFNFKNVEEKK